MVTDIELRIAAICNDIEKIVHDVYGLDLDVLTAATLCRIIEQMAVRRDMKIHHYYGLILNTAKLNMFMNHKEDSEPNERY